MKRLFKMNMGILSMALLLFLFASQSADANRIEADGTFAAAAQEIERRLGEALALHEAGEALAAKGKVTDAYFDVFEESGMETGIKLRVSEKRALELETLFGDIRTAVGGRSPVSEVSRKIDLLATALKEEAAKLDMAAAGKGKAEPVRLFLDSFIIIVREGFEAILVISALIAYLTKAGHGDKRRRIYLGAAAALPASAVTAVALSTVMARAGAAREGLEGATMLTATAVLFYVSYWLISRAEAGRWHGFIKGKVDESLGKSNLLALGFAAFLAVYREGAETILFYQALLSGAGEGGAATVGWGIVAGGLALLVIYILMKYLSLKVPTGPFFAATGALLYYLAFSFAGRGVVELQEAGWVSATPTSFPAIHLLGVYPTLEGLVLQGLLLAAAVGGGLYVFFAKRGAGAGLKPTPTEAKV